MCAEGAGISGGRKRSLRWRQGGCGDGRIRRFQGETDGWLPRAALAMILWLPRWRAACPARRAHSQYGYTTYLPTLGLPARALIPTLECC